MRTKTEGGSAQVLRGRGIGAQVGTLIGCGWLVYGLQPLPNTVRIPLGLLGLAGAIFLLGRARGLITSAKDLPAPEVAARAANRRAWTFFWINLVVEIVLLNVAVNLLARPALRPYWIPAISFVVGAHFLPMASFFNAPSYLSGGAAMMVAAVAVTLLIGSGVVAPRLLVATEAVGNAIILWSMAAWGLRPATRSSEPLSQPGR